jgi:hypothetical protein
MFVVEISAIGAEILRREIGVFGTRFVVVDALEGRAGVGVESAYLFRLAVNARAISMVIETKVESLIQSMRSGTSLCLL